MAFDVVFSPQALRDVDDYTLRIASASGPMRAASWREQIFDIADSLTEMPQRFALDSELFSGATVRAIPIHSHRILYRIDEMKQIVRILRVWHSSRRDPLADDIRDAAPESSGNA